MVTSNPMAAHKLLSLYMEKLSIYKRAGRTHGAMALAIALFGP